MIKLSALLKGFDFTLLQGSLDMEIHDISYDSRVVKPDDVFVCISGATNDAHQYIPQVIENGVKAIIVTKEVDLQEGITYIKVADSRQALAYMSCEYFHYPSRELTVIGLTGTKGKTTTSLMVKGTLEDAHKKVGIIGTNGTYIDGEFEETQNTTPISYELQRIMRKMVDRGCEFCVMEVSSQALKQDRVIGIDFDYGVFTNISPDHIGPNEHKDFDEYLSCKKKLFNLCRVGLFNKDDDHYEDMIESATCDIYTFALKTDADLKGESVTLYRENHSMGLNMTTSGLVENEFKVSIPGKVNAYNALVTILLAHLNDIPVIDMKEALAHVKVLGRGQIVNVSKDYTVIIDYAHNGVSFESIISAVESYHPRRIICVYGCGGKRSKTRRYECGETAAKHHVFSILTMDNPRGENVYDICNDIISCIAPYGGLYTVIKDRREAIFYALDHARKGDAILLLGKGHENYQIGEDGVTRYFSELDVLNEYKELHHL